MKLENLITYFLFECLPGGRVLEIGYLGSRLVVEDNTLNKTWWF